MNRNHTNPADAVSAFEDQFKEAKDAERWLAVVWIIKDGRLEMHRTTCQFPLTETGAAIEMLKRDSVMQMGLDFSPLPMAGNLMEADVPELVSP